MTMYANNFDHAKPFSDTCAQINLTALGEQTYTVPGSATQKYRAKFEFNYNANVFIGLNVTAIAPAGGMQTTTGNLEYRPTEPKFVKGGDVIHIVTPDAGGAYVGISLLVIPG